MKRRFFFPGEIKERVLSVIPSRKSSKPKDRPLSPLRKAPKHRQVLIYDFESKRDTTQEEGFTRPFMVGFFDHLGNYTPFWTGEVGFPIEEDFRKQSLDPGGCIDRFMSHVLETDRNGFLHPWTADSSDIYAHNGGRFDATFLLAWLFRHRNRFGCKITCIQGRAAAVRVWPKFIKKPKDKDCISFLDSALLLPMKLAQATTLFSKGETKEENFDRNMPDFMRQEWTAYNKRDCVGLRDAILGFRDMLESEGGELSMTAPSASMKLFRRRFLQKKIPRGKHFPGCQDVCMGCKRKTACDDHCHGCLHAWIRQGYFGGRVEIFERFAPSPIYYYDINSSYPASMLEPMPVGEPILVQTESEFLETHEQLRAEGKLAFVEATVSIPGDCPIPPLPFLHEEKLKFPSGVFSGVFEYDELMLLFDPFVKGHIVKIEKAVWFEGEVIFKDFVETLYKYRLNRPKVPQDKVEFINVRGELEYNHVPRYDLLSSEQLARLAIAELAKLMLNSLYGKFAMNEEREEVIFVGKEDRWPKHARPIDGRHETCPVWVKPQFVDPLYVIPQWSARITARSRARWWRAARDVVLGGGKVFYGDTDAVVSSIPFDDQLIHDTKLGLWKREFENVCFEGTFVLPKFYWLHSEGKDVVHMKGVPNDMQTWQTFEALVAGEEIRKPLSRTSQPKTVLRGLSKGIGPEGIFMIDSVKKLRSTYDKRIVHGDGTTSPLIMEG